MIFGMFFGLVPFAQNIFLIALYFDKPMVADGDALLFAVIIPDRAEGQRLGFFLQCEAGGQVTTGFRRADERRLQQRDEQRAQHVARANRPCGNAVDARIEIIQTDVHGRCPSGRRG